MNVDCFSHYLVRVTWALWLAFAFCLLRPSSSFAQEAITTMPTSTTSSAPLNPTPDADLHQSTDLRNEVSAEPRRFQYGFTLTLLGVSDANINISSTNRVSDYYYIIEPVLTLGAGDIIGHEDNYVRLDYAPSLSLFAHH